MERVRWLLPTTVALLALSALACAGGDQPEGAEATPLAAPAAPSAEVGTAQAGAPAAPPSPIAEGALPDLKATLQRGLCDNGPGNEGADGYFSGELTINGNAVSGSESWILFANPKWVARGGGDCDITWKVTGFTSTVGACGDCDLSVKVHGEPNINASKCVEGLVKKEAKPWDEQYDIKRLSDGTTTVFFHKSGKMLGQGYHSGGKLNYVSNHKCNWF
jgi:hypothetical protein